MWKDSLIVVEVVRVMAFLVILVSVVFVVVIVRNFWVFVGVVLVFAPTCNVIERGCLVHICVYLWLNGQVLYWSKQFLESQILNLSTEFQFLPLLYPKDNYFRQF
jgi:hypothetical protein